MLFVFLLNLSNSFQNQISGRSWTFIVHRFPGWAIKNLISWAMLFRLLVQITGSTQFSKLFIGISKFLIGSCAMEEQKIISKHEITCANKNRRFIETKCNFSNRKHSQIYWWDVKERKYVRLCRNKEKYVWWQLKMVKRKHVFCMESFAIKECKFMAKWILQKECMLFGLFS